LVSTHTSQIFIKSSGGVLYLLCGYCGAEASVYHKKLHQTVETAAGTSSTTRPSGLSSSSPQELLLLRKGLVLLHQAYPFLHQDI